MDHDAENRVYRKKIKLNNGFKNSRFKDVDQLKKSLKHKLNKSTLWEQAHKLIVNSPDDSNSKPFLQNVKCKMVIDQCKSIIDCENIDKIESLFNFCKDCIENEDTDDCRFIGWRKLRLIQNNNLIVESGFLEETDADERDYEIWKYNIQEKSSHSIPDSNKNQKEKILNQIGDSFKQLVDYEWEMREKFKNGIIWKRLIGGVRELCDICKTSIFNGHLACLQCGFSVCLACYQDTVSKKNDVINWQYCTSKINDSLKVTKVHEPNDMIYAQFIPHFLLCSLYDELIKFRKIEETINEDNIKIVKQDEFLILDIDDKSKPDIDDYLIEKFNREWLKNKPVLIKNNHRKMDANLWSPDSFSHDFGDLIVDLINCRNGKLLRHQKMSDFWQGFEDFDSRIRDEKGRPIICKLKDWPTTDDFKNVLESRYNDLMANLPIKQYTCRDGKLNLASYLPDLYLKPDLGPKMYIAYSSADTPKDGTTSLHIDISDAVNIMMYVGGEAFVSSDKPQADKNNMNNNKKQEIHKRNNSDEIDKKLNINTEIYKILKSTKCDKSQLQRFLNGEKPGALWHIFKPEDADKIRTYFSIKSILSGKKIKEDYDPIHDQTNYIDHNILNELIEKFDVQKPFIIIQYLGDAIFIPAGAPHQVRNLNSCIKVAGDFVSPQGIDQCLKITEQFRKLSHKHLNKEDKLQIKSIIYHTVKECLKDIPL